VECPALVWAIGLNVTSPISGRNIFGVVERSWTHGRLDCTFPVEEAGIIICNRETLDGTRRSIKEGERVGLFSELTSMGWLWRSRSS